jgi:hypothetical protein
MDLLARFVVGVEAAWIPVESPLVPRLPSYDQLGLSGIRPPQISQVAAHLDEVSQARLNRQHAMSRR